MCHSVGTKGQEPAMSKIGLWSVSFNLRIHVKFIFYFMTICFNVEIFKSLLSSMKVMLSAVTYQAQTLSELTL